jgi:catechol 2,3-dioxygenase-like lactoylglutathione lyase family enzyme
MEIEHFALNTQDPPRTAKWYQENLGMRIVKESKEPPYTHFLADTADHVMLEVYHRPEASIPDYNAMDPIVMHIAFSVDNMQETRERLLAAGASAAGEVTLTEDGNELAMLRDPWGVPIQLVKRKLKLM